VALPLLVGDEAGVLVDAIVVGVEQPGLRIRESGSGTPGTAAGTA